MADKQMTWIKVVFIAQKGFEKETEKGQTRPKARGICTERWVTMLDILLDLFHMSFCQSYTKCELNLLSFIIQYQYKFLIASSDNKYNIVRKLPTWKQHLKITPKILTCLSVIPVWMSTIKLSARKIKNFQRFPILPLVRDQLSVVIMPGNIEKGVLRDGDGVGKVKEVGKKIKKMKKLNV